MSGCLTRRQEYMIEEKILGDKAMAKRLMIVPAFTQQGMGRVRGQGCCHLPGWIVPEFLVCTLSLWRHVVFSLSLGV